METEKKHKSPVDSREAKRKRRRGSSNTYEKDMNKFLTIIYHNIHRLHEEKMPLMRRSCSEPHQLQLCGTPEGSDSSIENSIPTVHRFPRRYSDFVLQSSQSEYSHSPKALKRKVVFSDIVPEELT